MNLVPIVLFCFKRLDTLQLTIDALRKNYLAKDSDLIIFSDAAKGEKDRMAVEKVREYLQTIEGFKSVQIHQATVNMGLANSIIDGVTEIFKNHESLIVLEDDLVSSPNFLNFMNEALTFYKGNSKVFSIAGYSRPIGYLSKSDIYFTQRSASWGWAAWRDRWEKIDWTVKAYETFQGDRQKRKQFNQMGSDMSSMLDKQMTGRLDSWAIRWCFHQFLNDLYSVHPFVSKIENVGFTPDASNTKESFNRYKTNLDQGKQIEFTFSNEIKLDRKVIQQFIKPFTIVSRMKFKVLNLLSRN